MIRKFTAIVAVAAAFVVAAPPAHSQDYPNRLIKIIQGFPPGGNVDIIARILANEMEKSLGQSIVVEAKPGLAGALAAETVARSRRRRLHAAGAAERASGLWRAGQERQVQGGRRLHLDFGRELLSVHDLREGELALQDPQATVDEAQAPSPAS